MSMIIDRLRRAVGVAMALGGWAAIMLAMPFFGPAGRQVAVVGGKIEAIRAVGAAGGRIVEMRKGAILARSDDPWFALALYRQGARLVLEGRIAAGCFRPRGA